jgi:tetratricopeptide (TPR) repeat protein
MLGDHAAASAGMQEVLAMRRSLGDLAGEARALFNFGDILTAQGELQAAREALLAGQALARQHGLPQLGFAGNLGNVCAYLGQLDEAEGLLQEELALDRAAGRRDWEAEMLTMLGKVAAARGERGSARSHYRQGLLLAEELDFKALMLQALQGLAALCWQDGQEERAARLYAAHASLQAGLGARQRAADRPEHERNVEALRSSLGEAIYAACRAEGEAWDWQQAVNAALMGDGGP